MFGFFTGMKDLSIDPVFQIDLLFQKKIVNRIFFLKFKDPKPDIFYSSSFFEIFNQLFFRFF